MTTETRNPPESPEELAAYLNAFILETVDNLRPEKEFVERVESTAFLLRSSEEGRPAIIASMKKATVRISPHGTHNYDMLQNPPIPRIDPMAGFEIIDPDSPLNSMHHHEEDAIEALILIKGKSQLLLTDKIIELEPFKPLYIKGKVLHTSHNPGTTTSEVLIMRGRVVEDGTLRIQSGVTTVAQAA